MPLGIKTCDSMIVVSQMAIIGTKAEKIYFETPTLADLVVNDGLGRDYNKPEFSLHEYMLYQKTLAKGEPPVKMQPNNGLRFSLKTMMPTGYNGFSLSDYRRKNQC